MQSAFAPRAVVFLCGGGKFCHNRGMTPDVIAGDPVWQKIAGLSALIFLLWNMREGLRNGFWRKLSGLIAIGAAWAAASVFNDSLAEILARYISYPVILLRGLAGILIALAVFLLVKGIGKPRAAAEGKDAPKHSGFFGLVAGFFVGALWIVVVWSAVRFTGTLAECALQTTGQPTAQSAAQHPNLAALVKLKTSLDMGLVGEWTKPLDPLPERFYRLSEKTVRLLANPAACRALAKNPQLKPLLDDPQVTALTHDPEVQQLVREHNFHTLLRNEKVRTAADSPQVQAKLESLDMEAAIDAALAQAKAEAANPPAPADPK